MIEVHYNKFRNKILIPFKVIPKEGLSNEKIAMSLTIGVVSGFFPVVGGTTAIGFALLMIMKQNIAVVQAVNWIMAPLQLVTVIPFMRLGSSVFMKDHVSITIRQIVHAFEPGFWSGLKTVGMLHFYGVLAWTIIALPAGFLVYFLVIMLLRFIQKRKPVRILVNNCQSE